MNNYKMLSEIYSKIDDQRIGIIQEHRKISNISQSLLLKRGNFTEKVFEYFKMIWYWSMRRF